MKHIFVIILALTLICLLSACGGHDSDHGHPQSDDAEHGHVHGDDTHSHDAPETEAFYGDEATIPMEDAVVDDTGHTHDGAEQGHDSTAEHGEDEDSVEPHGHNN